MGAFRIDELAAPGSVGLGERGLRRHLCEAGIGNPMVAIGEGKLQRLDQRVHVFGRVVPNSLEINRLQHVQGLEQHDTLRKLGADPYTS